MSCRTPLRLVLCLLAAACSSGGLPVPEVPPDGGSKTGKADGPAQDAPSKPPLPDADLMAPVCGIPGEPCCAGNSCNNGGCCNFGLCIASGATCTPMEATCNGGACGTCGGTGQPCCASQTCTAGGTACNKNFCARCGGDSEPCCPSPLGNMQAFGGVCTKPNLVCDGATAFCKACGAPGGPCCADDTCGGGACCFGGTCVGPGQLCGQSSGVCTGERCSGCGGTGEACCGSGYTATCNPGNACRESRCARCGGDGEPCCPTPDQPQACTTGLTCSFEGVCGKCGGPGQPCCGGNKCAGAGCCFAGACRAPGGACTFEGKTYGACVEGKCSCGGVGEPCCPGEVIQGVQDWRCFDPMASCAAAAGSSNVRTCTRCGVLGASCCADKTCREKSTSCLAMSPEGFRCRKCGGAGEPCCRVPGLYTPFCDGNLQTQEDPMTRACSCQ